MVNQFMWNLNKKYQYMNFNRMPLKMVPEIFLQVHLGDLLYQLNLHLD